MTTSHADAHLETALCGLTLSELTRLQASIHRQLRYELPTPAQLAKSLDAEHPDVAVWLRFREADDAVKILMLLGAMAVAIAWLEHRHMPAPEGRLESVIARVDEGHLYMLPIPRCDQCFCGSGTRFKSCHGRPPVAAPAI